ncbi:MAG: M55 family metallopeptidase [Spirochaetes bacterium]|nr:M55 family metallopeptidase [Spirochaetota bacterium]
MISLHESVYIIADIEGSSGCWDYRSSQFMTPEWAAACVEMSRDMNAVVTALFDAGVRNIYIKDFHRTGYNLLPECIDGRARIIHGYRRGPVPGIGGTYGTKALLMIGMHASSGSGGFLAHTFTSRIARLEVNGRLMCEAEFFASSVAGQGLRPLFLSGCPVACWQAREAITGIETCVIDKSGAGESFDYSGWRNRLSDGAVRSLGNGSAEPLSIKGPFNALVTMRDGEDEARRIARRWGIECSGDTLRISAGTIDDLYLSLIRMCYFTPLIEKILPLGLVLYNAMGRAGLAWARHGAHRLDPLNN